jgi:excisionase family DNA binding protein
MSDFPILSVRIPEAVKMTGISRSRLYELMRSGEIETVKIGASRLILVNSLQTFLESHRAGQ